VLECAYIDDKIKRKLKARLQEKLLKLNTLKKKVEKEIAINEGAYGYIKGYPLFNVYWFFNIRSTFL
jgi:hypothetical protein